MDKQYFQKYYQDHKKEYKKRKKKWYKDNPGKQIEINKRYCENKRWLEKYLDIRKKATNKSNYSRVTSLKESYLKRYGNDLKNMKDDVTNKIYKGKMVCVDCLDYRTKRCPGWDRCKYREEILEEIKTKGG